MALPLLVEASFIPSAEEDVKYSDIVVAFLPMRQWISGIFGIVHN
jgi:hypothetical protein